MSLGVIRSIIQDNLYSVKCSGITDEIIMWCVTADVLAVGSKVAIADVNNLSPGDKSKVLPNVGDSYTYEDERMWYGADAMGEAKHSLSIAMLFFDRWQIECPEYKADQITSIVDSKYVILRDRGKTRVDYMDCDTVAFAPNDFVLVKFERADINRPVVVGFLDNPKKCPKHWMIVTSTEMGITGEEYGVVWNTELDALQPIYDTNGEISQPAHIDEILAALPNTNWYEMTFPRGEMAWPNLQSDPSSITPGSVTRQFYPGDKPHWIEYRVAYNGGLPGNYDFASHSGVLPEGPGHSSFWGAEHCYGVHLGTCCYNSPGTFCGNVTDTSDFDGETCSKNCVCDSRTRLVAGGGVYKTVCDVHGSGSKGRSVSQLALPNAQNDLRYSYVRVEWICPQKYDLHHIGQVVVDEWIDEDEWRSKELWNNQVYYNYSFTLVRWDGVEIPLFDYNDRFKKYNREDGNWYGMEYGGQPDFYLPYYVQDFEIYDRTRPRDIYWESGTTAWSGVGVDYVMDLQEENGFAWLAGIVRTDMVIERSYMDTRIQPGWIEENADYDEFQQHSVDLWVQSDMPETSPGVFAYDWTAWTKVGEDINTFYLTDSIQQTIKVYRPEIT